MASLDNQMNVLTADETIGVNEEAVFSDVRSSQWLHCRTGSEKAAFAVARTFSPKSFVFQPQTASLRYHGPPCRRPHVTPSHPGITSRSLPRLPVETLLATPPPGSVEACTRRLILTEWLKRVSRSTGIAGLDRRILS